MRRGDEVKNKTEVVVHTPGSARARAGSNGREPNDDDDMAQIAHAGGGGSFSRPPLFPGRHRLFVGPLFTVLCLCMHAYAPPGTHLTCNLHACATASVDASCSSPLHTVRATGKPCTRPRLARSGLSGSREGGGIH